MADIDDWVFESVLQFLKSPVWTVPIHGFIEEHCHEFSPDEEENKLVYTDLHKKFSTLVDELLSTFLEELGVSAESFVEAVKRNGTDPENADTPAGELSAFISEYILALDDYPSFRAMMEKRNVEMDLEAMYEYARYTSAAREADDMSDEERFLFEMAIHMSLGGNDIALKQLEAEDAELLQALALSVAAEQERLLREQLEEDKTQTEGINALNEEVRARRVENVERVVRALQASPEKPVKEFVNQDQSQPTKSALAPIGTRRSAPGGFTIAKPAITSTSASSPVTQPSFDELKKEVEDKLKTNVTAAPTKAEMEQRAAYFRKQRELLLKSKQAEREEELKKFQAEASIPSEPSPAAGSSVSKNITIALARRLKDDLINESRK